MIRALALAALLAIPASAQAACEASIETGRALPPFAEYDPFSPTATIVPFDIVIRNTGDAACELRLAMYGQPGPRLLRAVGQVSYEIVTPAGVVVRNDPSPQQGLPVRVAEGDQTSFRVALRLPAGQIVHPGLYEDQLELDLFGAEGQRLDRTLSLPVQARVRSRTQLNISGVDSGFGLGAGAANMDFGEVAPGLQRKLFMQLRSNSAAQVMISSENGGRLVNPGLGPIAEIPYTLIVDGEKVDLQNGSRIRRRPPMTLDGVNYEMLFRIEEFGGRLAGTYKDIIIVVVEPEE
jgi:hypothetical protein